MTRYIDPTPDLTPAAFFANAERHRLLAERVREGLARHNPRPPKPAPPKVRYMRRVQCVETGMVYANQKEVATAIKLSRSIVSNAIVTGTTAGGYHWTYEGQAPVIRKTRKPPEQTNACAVSIDGVEFRSFEAAAKSVGCSPGSIVRAIVRGKLSDGRKIKLAKQRIDRAALVA